MNYICVDRGTERCPCHLLEAGQCYTCTMVRDGICSCEDATGWQGSCPYTEYLQQGSRILEPESDCLSQFDVLSKNDYGSGLYIIRLDVPLGFAQRCQRPGSYVMAEALGWRTPISVLRAEAAERRGSGAICRGTAEFLVKAAGPKSQALAEDGCGVWNAAGPYYNGLLRGERIKEGIPLTVIARGTAAAPLIHLLHSPETSLYVRETCRIFLDDEALPEAFTEEYFRGQPYEQISLTEAETVERMRILAEETVRMQPERVLALFVSQYYVQRLTEGMTTEEQQRIIVPNPANLCCGMGICGACSHTDPDGVTVRLCKCSRTVVK